VDDLSSTDALMAASRSFASVTAEHLDRLKQLARDRHGIAFDPPDGPTGAATGRTPFGECVVHYAHDDAAAVLVVTLIRKPMALPAGFMWKSFEDVLERCRGLASSM
jgi:hypothetical protein